MYLQRKIDLFLSGWKSDVARLPLIVRGARQVGKTESILQFARQHYRNVLEINFVSQPYFKVIASEGYEVDTIIRLISRLKPELQFIPGETLIFFDEIQEYPELATALKFFKIDGRFDVICSGSLLGVHLHRIASLSVGYQSVFEMRSMDFEEFLWALGYPEDFAGSLLENMLASKPFNHSEWQIWESRFMDFILLGGMPAVVEPYITTGTFEKMVLSQNNILQSYRDDISKYAESLDKVKIRAVFDHIAPQLAKENKKFQMSKVAPGARSREYTGCLEWLKEAGIITQCFRLSFPELPLEGNFAADKYKVYMADTGLLIAMFSQEVQNDIRRNRNLGVYKGALYENFVAEALSKSGYVLYYYKRDDGSLEEDFFVRDAETIVPVEVKASNGQSKSLRLLVASDHYPDIKYGIKFIHGNIGQANGITTFPYFCAFLLKRYLQAKDEERWNGGAVPKR